MMFNQVSPFITSTIIYLIIITVEVYIIHVVFLWSLGFSLLFWLQWCCLKVVLRRQLLERSPSPPNAKLSGTTGHRKTVSRKASRAQDGALQNFNTAPPIRIAKTARNLSTKFILFAWIFYLNPRLPKELAVYVATKGLPIKRSLKNEDSYILHFLMFFHVIEMIL